MAQEPQPPPMMSCPPQNPEQERHMHLSRPRSLMQARRWSPTPHSEKDSNPKRSPSQNSEAYNIRDADMEQHFQEINRRIELLQNQASICDERLDININPPFTTKNNAKANACKLQGLTFENLRWVRGSIDYLESFKTLMLLHQGSDRILC